MDEEDRDMHSSADKKSNSEQNEQSISENSSDYQPILREKSWALQIEPHER